MRDEKRGGEERRGLELKIGEEREAEGDGGEGEEEEIGKDK